jgi:hypothetical protein
MWSEVVVLSAFAKSADKESPAEEFASPQHLKNQHIKN